MGTIEFQMTSDGVVDSNCKFYSLSNLYISGNSIFRTSGSNQA